MSRRRTRLILLATAGVMLALLVCAPLAQAKGVLGTGIGPTIGPNLNPLPSIAEMLKGVVDGLFGTLLSALTPGFLQHADIDSLEWLVELPNVADASVWPNVSKLEGDMVWVAGAILPTTLIIATAHDTAGSLTSRANPSGALLRFIGAVFWLVLYRFGIRYGFAFVDALTETILHWPIVAEGLHRTVLVMFGGALLTGNGGEFLALLGLAALVLAVSLFALKVFILTVTASLFVAGPLFIGLTPLPVLGYLARGWLLALTGVCLIPIGWCIIFAVAGAISLDVTNLSGGAHIGSRVTGAFAALATFYLTLKWPLMVLGHVRSSLGGLGVRPGAATGGGGGGQSDGALAGKAQRSKAKLQAAMLAGGRGIDLAAGALGAPRGGLVGVAGRQARAPLAVASATGAIATGPPRARPRPTATAERIASAGDKLRETPGQMREAWRSAGEEPSPGGSGRGVAPASQKVAGAPSASGPSDRSAAGVKPAAGPERTRRPGAKGSGMPPRKPSRAAGSSPGSAVGASSPGARQRSSSTPTGTSTPKGSATSTSKRPPVSPPARPPQAADPAPPKASGRSPQAPGSSTARRQASAPAQPGGGGTSRQTQTRPSTTQRPRPGSSLSHTAQPPAQPRKPNPPASRSTRPPAQPRQPNSPASRSTSTPASRPARRTPPSSPPRRGGQR
jgi:hypothetical protein